MTELLAIEFAGDLGEQKLISVASCTGGAYRESRKKEKGRRRFLEWSVSE